MVGSSVSHFEIVEQLGEGGMGVVYKARDTRLKRFVAIKALHLDKPLDADRRHRFLQEAQTASSLDHPNIVTIHDLLSYEGRDFIVMELVRGEPLRRLIPSNGLPWRDAVSYAAQVADAMAEAHAAGIVHRDLNPKNLMVTERGFIKVLDFGIAKLNPLRDTEEASAETLTTYGSTSGTLAYMSPEQALGEPVDPRSDIFSLGVVLYEMLTGARPFRGSNPAALLHEIHYGIPGPIESYHPDIPGRLQSAVERALEKSPSERYPTMVELRTVLTAEDLAPLLESRAGSARGAPETSTSMRRPLTFFFGLGLLVLFLVTLPGLRSATETDPFTLYQQGTGLLARYEKKGNLEKATATFQRMIRQNETSAAGHAGLARAYWRTYREGVLDPQLLTQAHAVAQRAVELDGFLAAARVSSGLILAARGRYEEAEQELELALVLDSAAADAWAGLADIYKEQERIEDADSAYRKALELAPDDRELHDGLGTLYFIRGLYGKAENSFQRSIELAPDGPYGYRNLSSVYFAQGRYSEASTVLQKALAIEPNSSLYSNLGTIFFYQGLYELSVTAFENALELSGGNRYPLWLNLGDAYRWTPDNQSKARQAFLRAAQMLREELASKPDNAELRSRLALCLAKRGDHGEAVSELEKIGPLEGRAGRVLFRITVTFEVMGLRDKTLEVLAATLRANHPLEAFRAEPELLNLRADPRYHEIVMEHSQAR